LGAPIHNRKRKKALLELAHHWMQAAVQTESTVVVNYSPPEHGPCKVASVGGLVSPIYESTRREK
jgi:hypothetical protein